jgi:PAS domain S-box-containing protein
VEIKLPTLTLKPGPVARQAIVGELSERQQIEDRLRKSEERYRMLAENAVDVIWTVDLRDPNRLTYVSPSITRLLGYSIEEAFATTMEKVFTPASFEIALRTLAVAMETEKGQPGHQAGLRTFELELLHKNGSIIPVEASFSFIRGSSGNPVETLAVVRDISDRKKAERELKLNTEKLMKAMEDMIQSMAMIVEVRDPYTAGHHRRVAQLASAIGVELKLTPEQLTGLRLAASIHDIGKVRVPTEILTNPNGLSEAEFSIIKMHPEVGCDIIKTIALPWPISRIIVQHHERLDGSGYPKGLKGEDIILEARILAVADVVDAISSHRPYRPSLGLFNALEFISQERGKLFDSRVVIACLVVFRSRGFKFSQ